LRPRGKPPGETFPRYEVHIFSFPGIYPAFALDTGPERLFRSSEKA